MTPFEGARVNPFDRLVAFFSPVRGARRIAARNFLKIAATYYTGASSRRLNANWSTGVESSDATIDGELPTLRITGPQSEQCDRFRRNRDGRQ